MRLFFIDSDLIYRGALKDRFDCVWFSSIPDEGYSRNMSCTLNYIRNLRFIT